VETTELLVEPLVVQVVVLTTTAQPTGSQEAVVVKKETAVQLGSAAVLAEVDQMELQLVLAAILCMGEAVAPVENKA
tara:strand:- start:469 stop:699 length:231 start_codon:yes stop_codon:yes gene_type:complete